MYADVIIDISHEKLDRVFQYRIPESLSTELEIGMQVVVPFGMGNKLQTGYVIDFSETTDYDPAKIKEIKRISTQAVPIESQLIQLSAWMRKNFGATMNQALKTVIPVKKKEQLQQKRTVVLAINDAIEAKNVLVELQRKHQTARARVLEALIEEGSIAYEILTKKLHVTAAVLRAMSEQGILRIESEDQLRNPVAHLQKKEYDIVLNENQQQIVDAIDSDFQKGKRDVYLIQGVTGSGKTEVYMELIARALEQGKQAIVLIPEIALTFQTVMRFHNRFGDRVSILHSRLSQGERYDQFLRAQNGELDVMIGPRSALFTPFPNLGYIIIDEEHEGSYKSETLPRYHARETAIERARLAGASVVLGSATPSVESTYFAEQGRMKRFYLTQRANARPLPVCEVIDLRAELRTGNKSMLSRRLQEAIADRLEKKQQIMLFLNRRGMAGFVSCRSCGEVIKCPHCDVSLSLHGNGMLKCHYCGYETRAVSTCPSCGSPYIGGFKAGTQKIEEIVAKQFPMAKILRMDYDTTRSKDSYEQILSAFANEEADILIGTQMIVKGHDFPGVTLVGILAADLSLGVSDYRAAERTFQLLTQAAGRAGRGRLPGEVIIQTYQPDHFAIQTAKNQDYEAFYAQEIAYRKLMCYPPVWNLLLLAITSPKEEEAISASIAVAGWFQEQRPGLRVIGPSDAILAKKNDIYRRAVYLKTEKYQDLVEAKEAFERYIHEHPLQEKQVSIYYDFNPMNGF
ncbi:MAG: primosomal protein N' [Lachnospiraceae bacterium]|nr:primosomal protein N' [Lachnospiraceae bacterium]